jgi:hypothetical protein
VQAYRCLSLLIAAYRCLSLVIEGTKSAITPLESSPGFVNKFFVSGDHSFFELFFSPISLFLTLWVGIFLYSKMNNFILTLQVQKYSQVRILLFPEANHNKKRVEHVQHSTAITSSSFSTKTLHQNDRIARKTVDGELGRCIPGSQITSYFCRAI